MTTLLTLIARPDAPIACDLTHADNTLATRLATYRELFRAALLERTTTPGSTSFRFAAGPGVQERLLELVRREALCCGFLSYEVRRVEDEVVWTIIGGEHARAAFEAMLHQQR